LSSAISSESLLAKFNSDSDKIAEYLTYFRADSIVRDCEILRKGLEKEGRKEIKFHLIGQSYGGFLITTYLSLFPDSLSMALFFGGVLFIYSKLSLIPISRHSSSFV